MDFLENAVNKARDVFDAACKKTGEVVSVQKQKYDIASLKSKLNKDFEAFGRACLSFVVNGEEVSSEARFLATEIVRKQEELEAAQQELERAQGKKLCPNCGYPNTTESHYCAACGNSFLESDAE